MNEIWEKVYKERRKKVGAKKARFSANAIYKADKVKTFLEDSMYNKIRNRWKEKIEFTIEEDKKDYRIFRTADENVIITTDKKVLKDYSEASKSGLIGTIKDEYTREIILKTAEENDIKLNPNLYYVVFSPKEQG